MVGRRDLLRAGVVVGAAALMSGVAVSPRRSNAGAVTGGTLDPARIPKYVTVLPTLAAMPAGHLAHGVRQYEIVVRQFKQQILPPWFRPTPVFGYGVPGRPGSFHTPALTIEARVGETTRIRWVNGLVDPDGRFRPHLLAVDPTLHWANPGGGVTERDMRPEFSVTPGPYRGPVPMVTHLHGAHVAEEFDGYPEAWYLPRARNLPRGYAAVGSFHERMYGQALDHTRVSWPAGSAVFDYDNRQRPATLWFHDHTLGLTRANVYAGMLGMYLLRGGGDDLEPGVLPGRAHAADSHRPYEREVVIQDKSFNADGTLHFPTTRGTFGDTPPDGPFLPTTDVSPIWNPEFFGNTMLVNGVSWPVLPVERRRYRFRVLNACNARTMLLKIASHPKARRPAPAALPIWVIGADGGYLPAPVSLETVVLGPAERLDVIVDFSQVPMGTELYLINEGPDEPFGGGAVGAGFEAADPGSTGQVMKFWVAPATAADHSLPPEQLRLPRPPSLGRASRTRRLSLNEISSEVFEDAPTRGMLGTVRADGTPVPLPWMADVTERPRLGTAEVWELHNVTEDAHPIHLHQVQFQVLDRRAAGGAARPPQPWETGRKDTVVALPGEVTRIKARFDLPGRYVWHCHILDHEDNEMMRPLQVEP